MRARDPLRARPILLALALGLASTGGCGAESQDGSAHPGAGSLEAERRLLDSGLACGEDPERQRARSEELRTLMQEDQEARKVRWAGKSREDLRAILEADNRRRARVGAIFGEGCVSSAADFAAAAMVFQHGYAVDHSFQAFLWARRALEKADPSEKRIIAFSKRMLASGIDRYLVRIGKRQLFGTQLSAVPGSPCFCREPVEPSFPDTLRRQLAGRTLAEVRADQDSLQRDSSCKTLPCEKELEPTPSGSVPGLW